MVSWRETPITDATAQALLGEYFSSRTDSFPTATFAPYRTSSPAPEQFEPPAGVFLVLSGIGEAGQPVDIGCGGIRRLSPGPGAVRFEVKHLWIRPEHRGRGYSRVLMGALEQWAVSLGATELVLDTHHSLTAAGHLYANTGYRRIDPYNDNPNATRWYGKTLPEAALDTTEHDRNDPASA